MRITTILISLGAAALVSASPPACATPPGFLVQHFYFTVGTNPGEWNFDVLVEDHTSPVKCKSTLTSQDFQDCTHESLVDTEKISAYIQEINSDEKPTQWFLHLAYQVTTPSKITATYYGEAEVLAGPNPRTRPVAQPETFEVKLNKVEQLITA